MDNDLYYSFACNDKEVYFLEEADVQFNEDNGF